MALLRYLSLLAVSLWVGGLVALGGIGAPALFDLLEARQPSGGRELAGILFGGLFERFQHVSWGLAGAIVVSLAIRALLGPRPRRFAMRVWLLSAMLALSLTTSLVLAPRITAIREAVTGPVASLSDQDPRRITFGRLHGLSNALMAIAVLAGLGLMWTESRD
jgi:hypothetical protein